MSIFKHEKEPHSLFLRWKPTEDAKTMLTEENMRLAISERTKGFTFEPAILKVSPRLAESTPDLTQSYSPGATLFQFSVPVFSQMQPNAAVATWWPSCSWVLERFSAGSCAA